MPFWIKAGIGTLIVIKLWLTSALVLVARADQTYDDLLFINLAQSLLKGEWLGPFNNLTLVKGPFYPIWLAFVHSLHIPLLLAQQLLYILACLAVLWGLRHWIKQNILLLAIFAILLFHPISYEHLAMTLAFREGIYPALSLLVIASALALSLTTHNRLTIFMGWALALGLSFAAFWLTREEGIWLLPFVVLASALAAYRLFYLAPVNKRRLGVLLVPFAIWFAAIGITAALNKHYYGAFHIVEQKSDYFLKAYNSLTRIRNEDSQPLIPMPASVRMQLYEVSPTFQEIQPFLEGKTGQKWINGSCRALNICDEIGGSWFAWALRDAIEAAGYYESATAAKSYYQRLQREIDGACKTGQLVCTPPSAGLLPGWHWIYFRPTLRSMSKGSIAMVKMQGFSAKPHVSSGPLENLERFTHLTRETIFRKEIQATGWVYAPTSNSVRLVLKTNDGKLADARITYHPRPDIEADLLSQGKKTTHGDLIGFEIQTTCSFWCTLIVVGPGSNLGKFLLVESSPATSLSKFEYAIEQFTSHPTPLQEFEQAQSNFRMQIMTKMILLYQYVFPLVFILGVISLLLTTFWQIIFRKNIEHINLLIWGLLFCIVLRLVLLAFLDVTSFSTFITPHYLAPHYPLLSLAVCLALCQVYPLLSMLVTRLRKLQTRTSSTRTASN